MLKVCFWHLKRILPEQYVSRPVDFLIFEKIETSFFSRNTLNDTFRVRYMYCGIMCRALNHGGAKIMVCEG